MWIQNVPGGAVKSLAYTPDGRTLYTVDGGNWVTSWDLTARTGTRLFNALGERVGSACRGGLSIAGGGRYLLGESGLRGAFIYEVPANVFHPPIRPSALDYGLWPEPNGTTVVRVGPGTVRRWDFLTQEYTADLGTWRVPGPVRLAELDANLRSMAVVTSKGEVYLADLTAGRPASKLDLSDPVHNGIGVEFSPDGNTLAILYHRLMYLWDVPTQRLRAKAVWSDPKVYWRVSFHPTAPVFAALNKDKVLTLFRLETGEPIRSLDFALGRAVRCVAFAPDGLTCAVGGSNKRFAVFDVDL